MYSKLLPLLVVMTLLAACVGTQHENQRLDAARAAGAVIETRFAGLQASDHQTKKIVLSIEGADIRDVLRLHPSISKLLNLDDEIKRKDISAQITKIHVAVRFSGPDVAEVGVTVSGALNGGSIIVYRAVKVGERWIAAGIIREVFS